METFLTYLLTIVLVMVVSVLLYYKQSYNYWSKRGVPTIKPTFPFGNFSNPVFGRKGLNSTMRTLYEQFRLNDVKFGGIYAGATPILMAIHPDFIKDVLNKDFQHFSSHGIVVKEETEPLNLHLFNMEGQKWKEMRAKLTPTFTSGKMKMMFQTLLDCGKQLEEFLDNLNENNDVWDIKEILACYTTDVIGSCAFGLECNSFKNPDAEFRYFGRQIFTQTLRNTIRKFLSLISPSLVKRLPFKTRDEDLDKFFLNVVKDMVNHRQTNNLTRNDFMQLLINLKKQAESEGKEAFTVEQMAAQAFVFFLAGFETSSTTMTFCLYELVHHQDIQDKLRDEINRVISSHQGNLTYDAVMEMKYLDQIIHETLRKYPPANVLSRVCTEDYQLPNGAMIEKGVKVFISTLGLHKDKEYFPDPERFDPDRFSNENKNNIHPYTYLPFGEGPRLCIGMRFGLMQTKVGLCLLLKNYKLFPGKDLKYPLELDEDSVVLAGKGPILLRSEKVK